MDLEQSFKGMEESFNRDDRLEGSIEESFKFGDGGLDFAGDKSINKDSLEGSFKFSDGGLEFD